MKHLLVGNKTVLLFLSLFALSGLVASQQANAVSFTWKGYDFNNYADGAPTTLISNVINGQDQLETTMTGKSGQFAVAGGYVNSTLMPAVLGDGVGINATNTPYVQLAFKDQRLSDGTWPGYEVFFADLGGTDSSRGSLGASGALDAVGAGWRAVDTTTDLTAFGNTGPWNPIPDGNPLLGYYGELKFSSGGTKRSPSYATSPAGTELALAANAAAVDAGITNRIPRTEGDIIIATIGQLSDGTIEYTIQNQNGLFAQWQSPYLKNHNGATIPDWNQIDIRFVGGGGPTGSLTSTATFYDFQLGGDYEAFRASLGPIFPAAPEPGSLTLLGLGSLLLAAKRRRK